MKDITDRFRRLTRLYIDLKSRLLQAVNDGQFDDIERVLPRMRSVSAAMDAEWREIRS